MCAKFQILTVMGAVISHFCTNKCGTRHGPLPHAKFHVYRSNVSPLWGEKPFLPRDAYAYRGLCCGKMSVRLSVRLTHAGIESKRLYISSQFLHHRVATPFLFFHTKRDGNIPTGTPRTGRRMQGGYEKITILDQYLALSRK